MPVELDGQYAQLAGYGPGELFGAYPEANTHRADITAYGDLSALMIETPTLTNLARNHAAVDDVIARRERRGKGENDTLLLQRARGRFCLLLNEDSELRPGASAALPIAKPAPADSCMRAACWPISSRTRFRSGSDRGSCVSVSTKPASTVSGVRISCETLATKSRRMASACSRVVTSRDINNLRPSP